MAALRATKLFSAQPDLTSQFVSLANKSIAEAKVLIEVLGNNVDLAAQVRRAKEIEHTADEIVHGIVRDLNRLFNSAFEREDLHKLASSLDDIIDFSYGAADRVLLYKIDRIPPAAIKIARLIQRQTEELAGAVSSLNKRDKAFGHCMAVTQLEHDADLLTNSAVADLFEVETDAIQLIKIKDLYVQLASATDRAKDAAQAIETMVLKRGLA